MLSLFQPAAFDGSLISYKYHLNDHRAIRFGLSYNGQNLADKRGTIQYYSDDTTCIDIRYRSDKRNIAVSVSGISYRFPQHTMKLYFGGGPFVQYSGAVLDTLFLHRQGSTSLGNRPIKETSLTAKFGLGGVYGCEWFFHKRLSAMAEYRFNIHYYYQNILRKSYQSSGIWPIGVNSTKYWGWVFEDLGLFAGISIYLN